MKKANDQELRVEIQGRDVRADRATLKKVAELVQKVDVEKPRQEDLRALRQMFESNPGLWRGMRSLADETMKWVLRDTFSPRTGVIVKLQMVDMKKEYGYEEAPALERTLIDHIILTWLQLQKTQIQYEYDMSEESSNANDLERNLNAAQGRYLRACQTLVRIRKLTRSKA